MGTVSLNGSAVVEGWVKFRLRGRWDAQLTIMASTAFPPGTPCTLDIGGDPFIGTVIGGGGDAGSRVTLTVVGGSDGLLEEVSPKSYSQPATVGQALTEALTESGELVGVTIDSDSDVLSLPLDHFTGVRQSCADRIKAVLAEAEAMLDQKLVWRIDATGGLYVARQIFLPVDIDFVLESEDPPNRSFTLALERASALPGRTVKLHELTNVTYLFTSSSIRAICTYGEAEDDKTAADLKKFIGRQLGHVDFYATYGFKLMGQNGDGTLELKSLDSRLGDMSRVKMKVGLPSTEVKLTPGTTVYVTHENGRPSKPIAVAWDLGPGMGWKVAHTAPIEFTAASIEMGGKNPLITHPAFVAWVAGLTTACAAMGISVPPFPDPGTPFLKG